METVVPNLAREIEKFSYRNGLRMAETLTALLDYIIGFADPDGKPVEGWKYNQEQNEGFYSLMRCYFLTMQEKLKGDGWHDAFGDLFLEFGANKSGLGQVFTPKHICDLMAECSIGEIDEEPKFCCRGFGKRITVNDPTCGSGRMLLAADSVFRKRKLPKPYLIGEDIDPTCCKQTAVNMMMHGCFGEVICHDTLTEPGEVRVGYIVNEGLYPFPAVPTIRRFSDPGRFVGCRVWNYRKTIKETEPTGTTERLLQPVQLSLF